MILLSRVSDSPMNDTVSSLIFVQFLNESFMAFFYSCFNIVYYYSVFPTYVGNCSCMFPHTWLVCCNHLIFIVPQSWCDVFLECCQVFAGSCDLVMKSHLPSTVGWKKMTYSPTLVRLLTLILSLFSNGLLPCSIGVMVNHCQLCSGHHTLVWKVCTFWHILKQEGMVHFKVSRMVELGKFWNVLE